MQVRRPVRLAVAVATVLALAPAARAAPEDAHLAELFNRVAAGLATTPGGAEAAMALADAGQRGIGNDLRLLRQAIDLRLSLGQRDAAIDLLAVYRKLDIEDELAQVQFIDLLTGRMQSAEERAGYLRRVVAAPTVSPTVRGHASLLLRNLLSEVGDDNGAEAALDEALKLSPANPRALQLSLDRALAGSGPEAAPKRAAAAVALLQCNPMQPATLALLAEELARCGAIEESAAAYRKTFDVAKSLGYAPAAHDAVNAAGVYHAIGKTAEAEAAADVATKVDPSLARAWFMKVLLAQQADPAARVDGARDALVRNVMAVHAAVAHEKFDPAAAPRLPDVQKDAETIKASADARIAEAYAEALGDLAFLSAYFTKDAPDAAVMTALKTLTGDNSAAVTRIEGYAALATGDVDAATVKFKAIAERDALARLGLAKLELMAGAEKSKMFGVAGELLREMPVDVWATMVRTQLAATGVLANADTNTARAVIEASKKLDDAWLRFPQRGSAYYLLSARAARAGVRPGEPILLTITLQNTSDRPLVIGPGGVIDQNFAVDASVRGTSEQQFPAAAIARLTRRIVVPPKQSVVTTARIDLAETAAFLNASPATGLSMFTSIVTNARAVQAGIVPGPGGVRQPAADVIDRRAESILRPDTRAALATDMNAADALVRARAVRSTGANLQAVRAARLNDDAHQQATAFAEALLKKAAADDASPGVRAAALGQLAESAPDADKPAAVAALLQSRDADARVLGCVMIARRPQAERAAALTPLAGDADEIVKRLATALIALPDAPAATQPAGE
ncbi:MAG TPA: hypothetical protein VF624_09550 [Tepidisphaeraceae bacterium]|jgi:tetratricopeptide (TPR) repeat protein